MQAFVFIIITFEFTGVLYTLFMFTIFHNNKGKDKEDVVHIHNEILLSCKKEPNAKLQRHR